MLTPLGAEFAGLLREALAVIAHWPYGKEPPIHLLAGPIRVALGAITETPIHPAEIDGALADLDGLITHHAENTPGGDPDPDMRARWRNAILRAGAAVNGRANIDVALVEAAAQCRHAKEHLDALIHDALLSGMSSRQVATLAGISHSTVLRVDAASRARPP